MSADEEYRSCDLSISCECPLRRRTYHKSGARTNPHIILICAHMHSMSFFSCFFSLSFVSPRFTFFFSSPFQILKKIKWKCSISHSWLAVYLCGHRTSGSVNVDIDAWFCNIECAREIQYSCADSDLGPSASSWNEKKRPFRRDI